MKNALLILMLVSNAKLMAEPLSGRAVQFLGQLSGVHQVGRCQLEIHVFPEARAGALAGEMLLTDARKREFYVPIYFLDLESEKFKTSLQMGRLMFHYEYEDRMPNPETRGVESIHVEIIKNRAAPTPKRVEVGMYLRKDYLEQHRLKKYQWAVCE